MKMTKRFGNFENQFNKKSKIDNFDDLWDDDLDINEIDNCFAIATQICNKDNVPPTQNQNVSLLPTYNSFKKLQTNAFTSTQRDNAKNNIQSTSSTNNFKNNFLSNQQNKFGVPSTSTPDKGLKRTQSFETATNNTGQLEIQIKKMKLEYDTKVGEVGILRSQLKQIKDKSDLENSKKEKEWSVKYSLLQKEMNVIKSELQFKNLEIANLKQRVVDVSKITESKQLIITQKKTESTSSSTKPVPTTSQWKMSCIPQPSYPLRKIPSKIFSFIPLEKYIEETKSSYVSTNAMQFLKYQLLEEETDRFVRLQPKPTLIKENKILTFEFIHPEISDLVSTNSLQFEHKINTINKVIIVSYQLISNIYDFLKVLKNDITPENIRQADLQFLNNQRDIIDSSIFSPKKWTENEIGISARLSVAFISELIPYSKHIRWYLSKNSKLENIKHLHYLPVTTKLHQVSYLSLIHKVTSLIGKFRLTNVFCGFLASVVALVNQFYPFSSTDPLLIRILQEVMFARPNIQVLEQFSHIFQYPQIVDAFYCLKPKLETKQGIVYCSKVSCILQVYVVLLDGYKENSSHSLIQSIHVNIAKFLSNVIRVNSKWIHQKNVQCDCLVKVVTFFVDVMCTTVKQYVIDKRKQCDTDLFRKGLKVLIALNSLGSNLIDKYVETYSQYKFIIHTLIKHKQLFQLDHFDVEVVENYNQSEETPTIDLSKFEKLTLWN